MIRLHFAIVLACTMVFWLAAAEGLGQQMNVNTPAVGVGHSFYENIGSTWGMQGRNWFFRFGGGATTPQFGGFTPNAGASGGFGFGGGGLSGGFNWWAGQGSNSSISSVSPSMTLMNGAQGYFSDTSQSPFVVGFLPVVGGYPQSGFVSPSVLPPAFAPGAQQSKSIAGEYLQALRQAKAQGEQPAADNFRNDPVARPQPQNPDGAGGMNRVVQAALSEAPAAVGPGAAAGSTADRPAMSVAEARRAHAAEQDAGDGEALAWIERARAAEEAGKANVAAIYYRMAAKRATGQLREQALARLAELQADGDR